MWSSGGAGARFGEVGEAGARNEGSGGEGAVEAELRRLVVDSRDSDATFDERRRRMAEEDSPARRRPVPPAASAFISFWRHEVPMVLGVSLAKEGGRVVRSVLCELPKACGFWLQINLKIGLGRPGHGLGPGPVASRPVSGAMGRPIPRKPCGLAGQLGTQGQPKIQMLYNKYKHCKNVT
jgi:hypothetical protein